MVRARTSTEWWAVTSIDWLKRTHRVLEVWADGERYPAPALLERPDFWNRPPMGPALSSAATRGGRGNRRSQSAEAKARRRALCLQAYELRRQGLSQRAIAARLGISKGLVSRWLYGVEPGGVTYAPTRVELQHGVPWYE